VPQIVADVEAPDAMCSGDGAQRPQAIYFAAPIKEVQNISEESIWENWRWQLAYNGFVASARGRKQSWPGEFNCSQSEVPMEAKRGKSQAAFL
jgi:hypothetical protein